jgi:hypothetical protein
MNLVVVSKTEIYDVVRTKFSQFDEWLFLGLKMQNLMEEKNLYVELARQLEINEKNETNELRRELLITRVNELLQNEFNKLIAILYRLDINEERLRLLLQQNPNDDAATIITDLIIERQLQKMKSREQFRKNDSEIDEDEKW